MKILLVSGPNLNMLGSRRPEIYGSQTLADIEELVRKRASEWDAEIVAFQSNHEGALIDFIQEHRAADGMIINPGAFGHYAYALRDALENFAGGIVEVHLSNVHAREEFRHRLVLSPVVDGVVAGLGWRGYLGALDALVAILQERRSKQPDGRNSP